MAGTLFGIGLSQQHDANGVPMAGCLLYVYAANTSTPVITYQDVLLSAGQEHPHPIVADANGRIPAFWVANGSYRARLTNAQGVVQFDEGNILAIGAGGDVTVGESTPAEAIFTTGDVCWRPAAGTKTGWVRINGRTIGSTISGATELADDDDALALYQYIYGNFVDALCPVTGGRSGNSLQDFNDGRAIQLLDMRSTSAFGLDTMGNTAASRLSGVPIVGGDGTSGGAIAGENQYLLTIDHLPSHTHANAVATSNGAHQHTYGLASGAAATAAGGNPRSLTEPVALDDLTSSDGAHTHTVTMDSTGNNGAHNTVHRSMLGTWLWKL